MLPQHQQDQADSDDHDGGEADDDGSGSEPRRRLSSAGTAAGLDDVLGLRPEDDCEALFSSSSRAPARAASAAARAAALVGALVVRHPSAAAASTASDTADALSAVRSTSAGAQPLAFDAGLASALSVIASALAASLDRALQVRAAAAAERRAAGLVALVKAVASERDTPSIIARLAGVAYDLLAADRVSVFLVDRENAQLIVALSEDAAGLRLPLSAGIAGRVAATGEPLNIKDAYAFPLFNRAFDQRTGYKTTSVLCVPCRDPEGSVTAVIQAINKMPPEGPALPMPAAAAALPAPGASGQLQLTDAPAEPAPTATAASPAAASPQPFSDEDAAVLALVADTAGVAIHKATLLEAALAARRATEALADAVRIVHDCAADDLETVMARLTDVAHRLVDADRVTLFLLDEPSQELFCQITVDAAAAAAADAALVASSSAAPAAADSAGGAGAAAGGDGDSVSSGSGSSVSTGGGHARSGRTVLRVHRVPVGRGVAGTVAASGAPANVPDCYADGRWEAGVEELPGYRSKTALFMPVRLQPAGAPASAAKTVAVIQAVNKRPGSGSGGVCLVPGGSAFPPASPAASGSMSSTSGGRASRHGPAVTAVPFSRDDEAVLAAFASEISGLLDRRALQLAFHRARLMEAAAASGGGGGGGDGSGSGAGGGMGGGGSGMMSFLTQFARNDGAPGAGTMGSSVGAGHVAAGGVGYSGGGHGGSGSGAGGAGGGGAGASGGGASGHSRVKSSTGSRDPPVPMSRRGSVVGGPPLLSSVGPASHHSSHSSLHGAGAGAGAAHTPMHSGRSSGGANSSAHGSIAGTARRRSSAGVRAGGGSLLAAAAEAAAAAVDAAAAAAGGTTQRGSVSAADGDAAPSGSAEASPAHGHGSGQGQGQSSAASSVASPEQTSADAKGAAAAAEQQAQADEQAAAQEQAAAEAEAEQQLDERILRPWLTCQPRPGRSEAAARVQTWDFDVLALPEAELVCCTADMLQHFGLLDRFAIPPAAALAFLRDVRRSYRRNPYHNYRHGVSVMHVAFLAMARSFAAAVVFSPLERLATLLAALCHDADHTGFNNAYEANSLSSLALMYNDQSVLEMHHAATMFRLLRSQERRQRRKRPSAPPAAAGDASTTASPAASPDSGGDSPAASEGATGGAGAAAESESEVEPVELETVVSVLGLLPAEFIAFRKLAIAGILATDMTHHNDLTTSCRALTADSSRDMPAKQLCEVLVHSADLSNPVLPSFRAVHAWTSLVCAEFTAQVEAEKRAGLPFAPHMDGLTSELAVAKLQFGFVSYIVAPLWTAVATAFPELADARANLTRNQAHWKSIVDGATSAAAIIAAEGGRPPFRIEELRFDDDDDDDEAAEGGAGAAGAGAGSDIDACAAVAGGAGAAAP